LEGGVVFDGGQRGRVGGVGALSFDLCRVMEDFFLHRQLDGIGQLEAVRAEELDSVVLPGIVRGRDHHPRLKAVGAGEEGDGRGGHNARAFDADAGLAQSGGESGGDPGAGLACVAAQNDARLCGGVAQGVAEGQTGSVDGGGVQRIDASDGANAVGSKEFACFICGHNLISWWLRRILRN
jgi:hypothetical protein